MTDTMGGHLHRPQFARATKMVDHGGASMCAATCTATPSRGYFSVLKRGLIGTYHAVSEAHLDRYSSQVSFRYSNRESLASMMASRADIALQGAKVKRLTHETTVRNGAPIGLSRCSLRIWRDSQRAG